MPEEKTSRVAMLWPEDLKEQVRERVGQRGLTAFTLDAVRAKLGTHDAHQADSKELNEVKDLAQRLADAIAMGGDYEDRVSTLRLMELPAWMQTVGWPEDLTEVVRPEESTPEPVDRCPRCGHMPHKTPCLNMASDNECDCPGEEPADLVDHPFEPSHTGMVCDRMVFRDGGGDPCGLPPERHVAPASAEAPAVGDPGTVRSEPPQTDKGNLLDRIRVKAAEKGVDLSGVDLKPASEMKGVKGQHPVLINANGPGYDPQPGLEELARAEAQQDFPNATPEVMKKVLAGEGLTAQEYVENFPEMAGGPGTAATSDTCSNCGAPMVAGECWECM